MGMEKNQVLNVRLLSAVMMVIKFWNDILLTVENFIMVSLKLLVIASLVHSVLLVAKMSKEGSEAM